MNNAYFIKLKFWGEVMRKLGVAFGLLLNFNAFAAQKTIICKP
jgi:hypothetical protein